MIETTIGTAATAAVADDPPTSLLMNLVVALIAPMFLGVTAGDVHLARLAGLETINAYRARDQADLLGTAQIIAFGLAALGSLSLSMADDISPSMALRLRGNANALNRSAEQNRRALEARRARDPQQHQEPSIAATVAADVEHRPASANDACAAPAKRSPKRPIQREFDAEAQAARPQPAGQAPFPPPVPPAPATTSTTPQHQLEKRHQDMWAIAMVKESGEISATIPDLPPSERRAASIRAAALSSCANNLLYDLPAPPIALETRFATSLSRTGSR